MNNITVTFMPQGITADIRKGATILDAAVQADIRINNLCGGEGICGRCRMIVEEGDVAAGETGKLTEEEIKNGYVLACQAEVNGNVIVRIPDETLADSTSADSKTADRFETFSRERDCAGFTFSPLVKKIYLAVL